MTTVISLDQKKIDNKNVKSTIAWFRLYEAASKNEHERAFLNYKLLMHSFENKGFKLQIQGDLHLSFFEVDSALKLFKEAMMYYFHNKDYIQMIVMYLKIKSIDKNYLIDCQEIENFIKKNESLYSLFF